MIPIGFVRFSIRMGWKWLGVDGKGYANTTYISEFHPHIPRPRFWNICFCYFVFLTCFETQNRFFLMLPGKYLTGVGQKDAAWKVSASQIDMIFGLWTESSKYELKHFLTTKSWIWGLWFFSDFSNPSFAWGTWAWEAGGTNGEIPGEPGRPVPSARSLRRRVRTL